MTTFKDQLVQDILRLRPVMAAGIVLGCFLCVFINNIGISASTMNPMMGGMFISNYFRVMGIMPTIIVGLGSAVLLFFLPGMSTRFARTEPISLKSSILAICLVLFIVEIAIMAAHCILVYVKTGGLTGFEYVPVAYVGMYAIGLFFAGLGILGYALFNHSIKGMVFAGAISAWCLLASMIGMMSNPMMVQMGAGSEWMADFYHLTITGLVDVGSLITIGTPMPDYGCLTGYIVIFVIAAVLIALGVVIDGRRGPQ